MRLSSWRFTLSGLAIVALLILPPGGAHAEGAGLSKAVVSEIGRLYEDFEYERAFAVIQHARRVPMDSADKALLFLFEGILWCEMGNFISGQVAFREALRSQPDVDLPLRVAPKIANSFEATRLSVAHERALLASLSRQSSASVPTQAGRDTSTEMATLMKRLARLSEPLHAMDSSATLGSLQELSAIGRRIKAAGTPEELQDASNAIDAWEVRHPRPER